MLQLTKSTEISDVYGRVLHGSLGHLGDEGRVLEEVVHGLKESGYRVAHKVIDAQPQGMLFHQLPRLPKPLKGFF